MALAVPGKHGVKDIQHFNPSLPRYCYSHYKIGISCLTSGGNGKLKVDLYISVENRNINLKMNSFKLDIKC